MHRSLATSPGVLIMPRNCNGIKSNENANSPKKHMHELLYVPTNYSKHALQLHELCIYNILQFNTIVIV